MNTAARVLIFNPTLDGTARYLSAVITDLPNGIAAIRIKSTAAITVTDPVTTKTWTIAANTTEELPFPPYAMKFSGSAAAEILAIMGA